MTIHARVLRSKTVFHGRVIDLKVEQVVEPGGVRVRREVVCHPGSVVVIPSLPDGRIVLVRQYRHAVRESLWELVAGGIKKGETPRQAARRELLEETGYLARRFKPLLEFYPSPGILSERMHLVEARELTPAQARPDEDEHIEVGLFEPSTLANRILKKQFRDAKTLVGLLWFFGNTQIRI
jgi:ADP-ribose pyrophosphatase